MTKYQLDHFRDKVKRQFEPNDPGSGIIGQAI